MKKRHVNSIDGWDQTIMRDWDSLISDNMTVHFHLLCTSYNPK